MLFKALTTIAVAAGTVIAQRPTNISVCDYYTTALLVNNTAANQKTLLTLLVNTAVIGNYTKPNVGVSVPGILTPGMFNGTQVNLAPYFDGGFASSNTGGKSGESKNFLDGGGATPLKQNMPATGTTSNQYILLTHLYEFFGALLGCSGQGQDAFPVYDGDESLYETHKFMDLSYAEVGYFIQQVALSGASFGVAESDLAGVGTALNSLFGYRCAAAVTVIPAQGPQLQSICTDAMTCPLAPNNTCSAYDTTIGEPKVENVTMSASSTSSGKTSPTATGTTTPSPMISKAAGSVAQIGLSVVGLIGGVAALLL